MSLDINKFLSEGVRSWRNLYRIVFILIVKWEVGLIEKMSIFYLKKYKERETFWERWESRWGERWIVFVRINEGGEGIL